MSEIEKSFWKRFDEFNNDFYGYELAAVDEVLSEFINRRTTVGKELNEFSQIASEATKQIEGIQSAN